jgi:putative peptide zinc metalloprotease protein
VKDPRTDRFFRFGNVEGFILGRLDGASALESIRQTVESEFGAKLSPAVLDQFIARLQKLGLLDGAEASLAKRKRIEGNVFYLRFRAFDPDRLFTWLARKVSLFFTPAFVGFSAVTILIAVVVSVANWPELQSELPRLYTFQSLAVAWTMAVLVIVAHEFAHGLTCKHHGGKVREIGFLLIFLQPAFYCNVSDAWLFREKSKRLWVTFAGAWFEMFLWAGATLVWRITEPNTLVNYLALVVVATSAIKTFFNLNPLIKLDGYYLLSDWLEVPNLRQRAFAYLGRCVERLWSSPGCEPIPMRRERAIFLVYGVLAWTYSFWLLAWVLSFFAGILVRKFQGWGFIFFVLSCGFLFHRPVRKVLHAFLRLFTVRESMRAWVKRLVWLAILAGGVVALFRVHTDLKIPGSFTILPLRNADVRAEVEGIIQEIFVDEGEAVQPGGRVAALFDRDYRAELRKTKAETDEKEARLRLLKAGTRPEEIEIARTTISKGSERIKYAQSRVEMDKALMDQNLLSRREYDETRELLLIREKELQEFQDKLKLLLAGSRKEEIEAVDAEIARLKAQQRYLEDQLALLAVNSPIAGIVTTHRLKEKVGLAVKKGDLIAEIKEMNTIMAEIAVTEKEIGDVKLGQKIVLKARAYPGASFEGTVSSIAPVANADEDARAERTVLVTTRLDNASLLLKPGMTGHAKIYAGDLRLIDLVLRRIVRFVRVEFWSWW